MRAAIDAIPGFDFVWQFVTLGAFVGALVAYRRTRSDRDADPFQLTVRWSCFGLFLGLAALVFVEVVFRS